MFTAPFMIRPFIHEGTQISFLDIVSTEKKLVEIKAHWKMSREPKSTSLSLLTPGFSVFRL